MFLVGLVGCQDRGLFLVFFLSPEFTFKVLDTTCRHMHEFSKLTSI